MLFLRHSGLEGHHASASALIGRHLNNQLPQTFDFIQSLLVKESMCMIQSLRQSILPFVYLSLS